MYFKQLHRGFVAPIIHANGPSKFTDTWKDAVEMFFSEDRTQGILPKDLTVLTWSIPDERTLIENNMLRYSLKIIAFILFF